MTLRAADEAGTESLKEHLEGPTALTFVNVRCCESTYLFPHLRPLGASSVFAPIDVVPRVDSALLVPYWMRLTVPLAMST